MKHSCVIEKLRNTGLQIFVDENLLLFAMTPSYQLSVTFAVSIFNAFGEEYIFTHNY
jgi:hypothetical protein